MLAECFVDHSRVARLDVYAPGPILANKPIRRAPSCAMRVSPCMRPGMRASLPRPSSHWELVAGWTSAARVKARRQVRVGEQVKVRERAKGGGATVIGAGEAARDWTNKYFRVGAGLVISTSDIHARRISGFRSRCQVMARKNTTIPVMASPTL